MTIRLTQLEDRLAAAPEAVARDIGTQLDVARQTLQQALHAPLAPAQHALAQSQMQAVRAAEVILEGVARRYATSYGSSS
ncbi:MULTISPECIES: EscE/YscE/SsaE family type III secretion system needle protein co-chaperone [Pandoraea]|uniref:EscE/YscE/SsaE family type III secretion system needle protein co-chaperone n=1 Tax=Pandoraea cepalis TaxID=2508294 RepID=A0A5E4SMP6_9BURK|nr:MULTISPECIES: EscE/YscE/SsaE family type III secretion system needle protein co-chaperone [Pandoraea]VVD76920.1 EscE/YscE/SsaE family type III secretion system needle protein co-chaperone [Pandoraea cepalis]